MKYRITQIITGILMIIASILDAILLEDLTLSVIFIPLGIYLVITKNNVIEGNGKENWYEIYNDKYR